MFSEVLGGLGITKATATNGLLSAGYLVLGGFGLVYASAGEQGDMILGTTLAALTAAGLLAWLASYKRYRLIADTPTSQITSAAQGYVELVGRCEPHSNDSLLGFGPIPGCVASVYSTAAPRGRLATRGEPHKRRYLLGR